MFLYVPLVAGEIGGPHSHLNPEGPRSDRPGLAGSHVGPHVEVEGLEVGFHPDPE